MLTDKQLETLAVKMKVPLERICFKDELKEKPLKYNKFYIINSEDEIDEASGIRNEGAHWTAFQVNKTKNGTIEPMYFDSYGIGAAECVKDYIGQYVPYNKKDVQSLMGNMCGWYCMAWGHFINSFKGRTGSIYHDTEEFLEHFDDLNNSCNFKKNEYILKLFFQAENPSLRKDVEVLDIDEITGGDTDKIRIPLPLGKFR